MLCFARMSRHIPTELNNLPNQAMHQRHLMADVSVDCLVSPPRRPHERIQAMDERAQSLGEEIANSVSHGVALLSAVIAVPFLILASARHGSAVNIAGASVFAGTMVLLYFASTLYHAIPHPRAVADGIVTISVGVASAVPVPGMSPEAVVEAADRAMYVAKSEGRDRVRTALLAASTDRSPTPAGFRGHGG